MKELICVFFIVMFSALVVVSIVSTSLEALLKVLLKEKVEDVSFYVPIVWCILLALTIVIYLF